ncbi:M23 family metallopeptidase [Streptomyces hainanensis]|uniref:M23ase beta-sheet core domain-containing protein n=1 Tax=Streptomyces hainanensis TaxID=402648 RepID=A0A4R4TQ15_9ACTN|nr:M23 family metallopeptidase [Streptomyces hainanensis]TDC80040.1 hypothetical protein E1283_01245 [Streptomyces hainanensis]
MSRSTNRPADRRNRPANRSTSRPAGRATTRPATAPPSHAARRPPGQETRAGERHRRPRPSLRTRLARRALGGAALGAVVLVGPWTAAAAGHAGAPGGATASPQPSGAAGPLAHPGPSRAADVYVPYEPAFGPLPVFDGRRKATRDAGVVDGWTSPVSGFPVTAVYAQPGGWAAGHHTGVDFATPVGTPIRAVGPGTVVLAEYAGSYGNHVVTKMADGHYVLYAHLAELAVRAGQRIDGGTRVGDSGNTGNSTGPHLHFEVRAGRGYGTDVDPITYLASHGIAVDVGPA